MIRHGSKSFAGAARLFDARTRDAVVELYAWCRYCDDQVDGQSFGHPAEALSPHSMQARLQTLYDWTRACYRGEAPEHPVFAAFQHVTGRYGVPERYPLELLKGLEMDVLGHRYHTFDELLLYCWRVAGTVGVMMARLLGARNKQALKHAVDLGIAMQLTNIARDVFDDARAGRIYLPLDWLEQEGVPPHELTAEQHRQALVRVVHRLQVEARRYYASGDQGLRYLPFRSACAVAAAREVYADIGARVEARGTRAWERRVVVPRWRKLWLASRSLLRVLRQRVTPRTPYLLPSRVFLQPDESLD
jgi:phytoene synthase